MAKLEDVCSINMGQSPESSSYNETGEGIPFFQGNADFGELHPTVRVWCNAPTKIAKQGDILISVRAPIGALNIANVKCCIGRGLAALSVNERLCYQKYLWYALECKVDELNSKGTGSTFKAINKKTLAETEISLPLLDEQRRIAAVLDKVSGLIAKRREQLDKLDELVKARFVEMFGTIHNNIYNFSIVTLQDVSAPIKDGTHQTPTYTEDYINGYKFLSSKDVTTGKIDWSHLKYIPEDLHRELYARIAPRKGDILLAKNGTTGIAAIVDRDEVFDIYVSLALIRPISVHPFYLWAAINADETKCQFNSSLKGIGVPNLHLGEIKKAKILLPPAELQGKFAVLVKETDKTKLTIQQSLDKLEALKKALMQQYFGG